MSELLFVGLLLLLAPVLPEARLHGQEVPRTNAETPSPGVSGFKQSSLPVLHRSTGSDPAMVRAVLVERLCPKPCRQPVERTPGNMLEVTTESWSLQVLGDGTSAKFQDLEVGKRAHSLAKTYDERATPAGLEQAARKFIDSKLASVIVLGPEEELIPIRTDYRIEGGYNIKTKETIRSVVANRIVFGRSIRGVPIVGGGSTVILTFANDGSLESFQYDWPKYEQSTARAVVNEEELLRRVRMVIGMRIGVPVAKPLPRTPNGAGQTNAVELMKNTILQKLECGYYDPGYLARISDAPVQPGCVYHAVSQGEDGTRSGFAGAVPGAAQIEGDSSWPEAVILRGTGANGRLMVPGSSRPY